MNNPGWPPVCEGDWFPASLGVLSVLATLREAILFSESTSSAVQLSDERLAKELSIQLSTYLGVARRTHPSGTV